MVSIALAYAIRRIRTRGFSERICEGVSPQLLRPLKTRCNQSPHYRNYDCANDCADETSTFASLIPSNRLATVCCYKGSNNPEQGCQNKPLWLVLVARM